MDFTDDNTIGTKPEASNFWFGIKRSQVQILSPRLSPDKDLEKNTSAGTGGLDDGWEDKPQQPAPFPKGPKTRDNWIVDPATGCHLWSRCIDKDGYGYFRRDGKQVRAHVHYYELEHGGIPAGMEPDHLCRTRHCVNPDHIEIVPKIVNIRRGKAAKLTMDKAREIRRLAGEGMSHSDIGQRFGVKRITVYFVVSNRLWKEEALTRA